MMPSLRWTALLIPLLMGCRDKPSTSSQPPEDAGDTAAPAVSAQGGPARRKAGEPRKCEHAWRPFQRFSPDMQKTYGRATWKAEGDGLVTTCPATKSNCLGELAIPLRGNFQASLAVARADVGSAIRISTQHVDPVKVSKQAASAWQAEGKLVLSVNDDTADLDKPGPIKLALQRDDESAVSLAVAGDKELRKGLIDRWPTSEAYLVLTHATNAPGPETTATLTNIRVLLDGSPCEPIFELDAEPIRFHEVKKAAAEKP